MPLFLSVLVFYYSSLSIDGNLKNLSFREKVGIGYAVLPTYQLLVFNKCAGVVSNVLTGDIRNGVADLNGIIHVFDFVSGSDGGRSFDLTCVKCGYCKYGRAYKHYAQEGDYVAVNLVGALLS